MKLQELIDVIQRQVNSGKNNQYTLDPLYLKKMIHSYRAEIIEASFRRDKMVGSANFQRFYLQYDKDLQASAPNGAIIFKFPQVITLASEEGDRYAGSIKCSNAWRKVESRQQLSTLNSIRFASLSNRDKYIYYLIDNPNLRIEIYNANGLTEGMIEGVFANPCDIYSYNEDVDDYPLDSSAIAEMVSMIYREITSVTKATKQELDFNKPETGIGLPPHFIQQSRQPQQE